MSFTTISHDKNILTEEALKFRYKKFQAKKALQRAFIFGLILFGIWFKELLTNFYFQIIFLAIAICCLLHIAFFMISLCQLIAEKPLYGTKRQRKLLNIEEKSLLLKVLKPIPKIHSKTKANNLQAVNFRSPSSFENHRTRAIMASTPNKSNSYSSKLYKDFERKMELLNCITDEKSFQDYLITYERTQEENSLVYTTKSYAQSQAARLLQTSVYQLAVDDSKKRSLPVNQNYLNSLQTYILAHISLEELTNYVLNLRHWISVTILKPLINEIDNVNIIFDRLCLSEFRIGETGLEQLRRLVNERKFVIENVHRLPMIMDYLEICFNQTYLLERLRSLADGPWLSNYTCRVNANAQFLKLPNDAAIIFQCICKYFDRQLQPFAEDVKSERPFINKYVIMNEESKNFPMKQINTLIRNRSGCAILCTNSISPKFNLVTNERLCFEKCGFNNLFHVLLGFLIHMKRHNDGMLEGVSLGRNGINILWTIRESDCN